MEISRSQIRAFLPAANTGNSASGWEEHTGAITGQRSPIQGGFSVADPRHFGPAKHSNEFRIVPYISHAQTVSSAHGTGQCVADPRRTGEGFGKYAVTGFDDHTGTVISGSTTGRGPTPLPTHAGFRATRRRLPNRRPLRRHALERCHWRRLVSRWPRQWPLVGRRSRMPQANDKLIALIEARDGTWHRPFTTLELAAIQSLVEPEGSLELDGLSDSAWRERIGNAVPPAAAGRSQA